MIATDIKPFIFIVPQEILVAPFESYTLKIAQDIVNSRLSDNSAKALSFYNGDHWQNADAWIGPTMSTSDSRFQETMQAIERTFISHNAIAEITERHVSGVLARELHWSLTVKRSIPPVEDKNPITGEPVMRPGEPDTGEQALVQEAQDALVEWWNERNVLETLKHALTGLLNVRRSPLRFSVPPGLRDRQGNLPKTDLAGALDYLYLDHMGYDDLTLQQMQPYATVWENKNTRQPVGVFVYLENNEYRAEICYVDEQGNTVLRILDGDGEVVQGIQMPLGRRILMHEMTRKALVTPQIMSQQRSLNKTLSMKDRNDTQAGYLERYLLNVKWPGKDVINPTTGEPEFVPDTMFSGPGTINSLQGTSYVDEQGNTRVLDPSVQFRDPVSAMNFIESSDHTYLNILKESNQLHYAEKDMAVSGESRKQSRDSYTKDLQSSANVVEAAARWIIETALAQAAFFMGSPGRYDGLRAYVQAKIDPGPVSPDDMRVAAEMMDRGLWDWETAVSATGVDDVDAIKQRLNLERAENDARMAAVEKGQTEGEDGEEDEALGPTQGLNGIQIRAAGEILDRVGAGTLNPDNAIELLASLGIDQERASQMVGRVKKAT